MVSVPPPAPMTCIKFSCYRAFVKRVITYGLLLEYHRLRVKYAEKHRDRHIPERYRTGEPAPTTAREAIKEILKLRVRR